MRYVPFVLLLVASHVTAWAASTAWALEYPCAPYNEGRMDPQLTGWPLTDAERAWVNKGEYFRKPGHESQKHRPDMWFVTPTAAHWKPKDGGEGNPWIDHHATNIERVKAAGATIDIALLGDSITQGWGGGWDGAPFNAAWQKHFGDRKTVNLGIGGDRIESILWRLDHGALDGVSPKVVVLMIGVNNAPLDGLKLDRDPQVHVLDLTNDFANADGTLKTALYSDGHLHLGPAGYEVLASKLKLVVEKLMAVDHQSSE